MFEKLGRGTCQCEESVPDFSGVCQNCSKKVTFDQPIAEVERNEVDVQFTSQTELQVFSWTNVNSISPTSSSLSSRTMGDRSGRYKLQIGESKWKLIDTKVNKTLGAGFMSGGTFSHKNLSANGANIQFLVDGGRIDIYEPGGGATLFSSGHKDLARKFDFLSRIPADQLNPSFIIGSQSEVVLDSVYLGGAGIPLKTYQKTLIHVSENGFLIGQPNESMWANSYEGLIGIQISGEGLYQTGGGWIGGGFGVGGALKGAAFASVMNALTTRTHNDCYFRFVYSGVEGNFQILSHTPRDLEIALSGVRNWLETRSVEIPNEQKGNSLASSADELEKLWELHKKGILTEEEFKKEKRKILDR